MTHPDATRKQPARNEASAIDDIQSVIAQWTQHLIQQDAAQVGEPLPPHSPDCVGCGPHNDAGLRLTAVRATSGVETTYRFSNAQVGAPGIAHGGAVALVFDDLFGFALYTVGALAVTRSLTVEYFAPFLLHRPYRFQAEVVERSGNRLTLCGGAWDESRRMAGSAEATFIEVDPAHFATND